MTKTIVSIVAAMILCGCTSSTDATKALKGAGYTDINITGYAWFECGKDDTFATGFTATGPTGEHVEGAVCSGFFKGSTIRTN
jgi:hypothetical protein